MFCPGCGFQASDDLNFCRQCGANLRGMREAITSYPTTADAGEKLKRRHGASDEKRIDEIKSGVITCFVGIGVMIFLRFFMAVVAKQNPADEEIVRSLWLVGIIPFMIGAGHIFNGLFVSHRLAQLKEQQAKKAIHTAPEPTALPAKTTDQLVANASPSAGYSVIEDTTAHLPERAAAPSRRETG